MHSWIFKVQLESIESDFPACTTEHFKGSKHFCVRTMKANHFCRSGPMISGQVQNMMNTQLMTTHERSLKCMQEFFIKAMKNLAVWYTIPLTMEPSLLFPFLNQSSIPILSYSTNKTSHMQSKISLKPSDPSCMMENICIFCKAP